MDVLLAPLADTARADLNLELAARPSPAPSPEVAVQPQAAEPSSSRMIIEERDGRYVYKIYDPRTGEILRQVPDEQLLMQREALQEAAARLREGARPAASQLPGVVV